MNDPVDQAIEPQSMIASPIAAEPPEMPAGPMIRARPPIPTTAATLVAVATCSRASVRHRITWSGTDPAIIAATLESIRVSARVTTPTPQASSMTPITRAARASRHGTRRGVRRRARIVPRRRPATVNRSPAERRGGIVSTEILIAKYVDPQTR